MVYTTVVGQSSRGISEARASSVCGSLDFNLTSRLFLTVRLWRARSRISSLCRPRTPFLFACGAGHALGRWVFRQPTVSVDLRPPHHHQVEFEAEELLSSRIFDLVRMRMQGMPFMAANNAEQGEAKTVEQEEGKGEEEQMEEAGEKHWHEEEAEEDQEEEAEIQEGKEEHGYEEDEEEVEEKIANVLGAEPEALENEVRKTPVKTDTIFFCVQEYVRKSDEKVSQKIAARGFSG